MSLYLIRAEWMKMHSLRSTWWSLGAMIVVTLGVMLLGTFIYTSQYNTLSASEQAQMHADAIGLILQPGATFGQVALCVMGVMMIAGEYASGMIRTSLLAVPRRLPLLAAKGAVLATLMFVIGAVLGLVAFLVGRVMLRRYVSVSLGDPGVIRAILGLGLYLGMIGLFALAIGALIRHTAGALTAVIALVFVANAVTGLIPGSAGNYISAYLPSNAGLEILSSGRWAGNVLTPWQGYAVLCGWTVLLMALAAGLLVRRDA
jgi:ABC-type transport system involved in multi-copper enzyme maturation permease subunit